jgi:hypothetical protein
MSLDRKQESKNVNNNIMSDKTGGIFGQWKERRKGEKRPTEKKHFWNQIWESCLRLAWCLKEKPSCV